MSSVDGEGVLIQATQYCWKKWPEAVLGESAPPPTSCPSIFKCETQMDIITLIMAGVHSGVPSWTIQGPAIWHADSLTWQDIVNIIHYTCSLPAMTSLHVVLRKVCCLCQG